MKTSAPTASASTTQPIAPDAIYPLAAFIRSSGLSKTRLYEARRRGTRLKTLSVGRRKFVRGRDGIRFIERLAKVESL